MNDKIKNQLQGFLMGEDDMVENVENKIEAEVEGENDSPTNNDEDMNGDKDAIIIDKKVITESGKLLLKD